MLHLHEPMTPAICVATLALARCPLVATWHAAGDLGWMRGAVPIVGLPDRADRLPDRRLADGGRVGRALARRAVRDRPERRRASPSTPTPRTASTAIVFIGRHDARKGLPVLLRAWPEIRRRTGARLRLIGTDPLQYRLLHSRMRFDDDGIDVLGIVTNEVRSAELAAAKVFVSPALGGESFGLVLAEAFATATPVVASDIPGFADVATPETAVLVPPGDEAALADALAALLADEERRVAMGRAARRARGGALLVERRRAAPRRALREGRGMTAPRARWHGADPGRPARARGVADLVARARVEHRPRRLHRGELEVGRRRVGLNLLSIVVRAASWHTVIKQAVPAAAPALPRPCSRRSASACSRTSCCPAASASSRASPCSRGGCPSGRAIWATLIGSVFAHRAVRPLPRADARRLGAVRGEAAALGGDEPRDRVRDRLRRCSTFAIVSAKRQRPGSARRARARCGC